MTDKRTVSAGFIVRSKTGKFLLGKPKSKDKKDCWSFFKGHQEDGESLIETAARELKEETGIDVTSDPRLTKNMSTNPVYCYSMKKKDVVLFLLSDNHGLLDNFDFRCDSFFGKDKDNPEMAEFKWFDLDEMYDALMRSQKGVIETLKGIK